MRRIHHADDQVAHEERIDGRDAEALCFRPVIPGDVVVDRGTDRTEQVDPAFLDQLEDFSAGDVACGLPREHRPESAGSLNHDLHVGAPENFDSTRRDHDREEYWISHRPDWRRQGRPGKGRSGW